MDDSLSLPPTKNYLWNCISGKRHVTDDHATTITYSGGSREAVLLNAVSDNYNLKSHKYVRVHNN